MTGSTPTVGELLVEYDRARAYTDDLWRDLTPDEVVWRPDENSSAYRASGPLAAMNNDGETVAQAE